MELKQISNLKIQCRGEVYKKESIQEPIRDQAVRHQQPTGR